MDIDQVKENIQPLRGGRNTERLQTAMLAMDDSHQDIQNALNEQRRQFETSIVNNVDEDPLEKWYEYITWIEQSYPKSGKESPLDEVIMRSITTFEKDERYKQDRRMIKLYMKYIDSQPNPQEFYQELYNQGIGTMCADLYIGWAYYYDAMNNFKQTEDIYKKGLDAHAEPFDELEMAHKSFGFSMSQRILYNDEDSKMQFLSSLEQRRHALTSLRLHKKKNVGSVRTGMAVKHVTPGIVNQENIPANQNTLVKVYSENQDQGTASVSPNICNESHSIFDNIRKKENTHEPGPWSKAKMGKAGGSLKINSKLSFQILEESDFKPLPYTVNNMDRGIQLPANFKRTNKPETPFEIPIVICEEDPRQSYCLPKYNKICCYPQKDQEFSIEEVRAYNYLKKHGITNRYTMEHDKFWTNSFDSGIRLPPNFYAQAIKENEWQTVRCINDPPINSANTKAEFDFDKLYPPTVIEEFSIEELIMEKWKQGLIKKANLEEELVSMDETVIGNRRVSYYPIRQSIMPRKSVAPAQFEIYCPPEEVKFAQPKVMPEKPLIFRDSVPPPTPVVLEEAVFKMPNEVASAKPVYEEDIPPRTEKEESIVKSHEEIATPIPTNIAAPKFNFEIFEDSIVTNKQTEFLKPQIPAPKHIPFKSLIPLRSEDDENAGNDFVNPDETCSTQTFNFFIKSQSVSTPKTKKSIAIFEKPAPSHCVSPVKAAEVQNTSIATASTQPKYLSVIMETTENNTASTVSSTVSSGVNTKSTLDTQMSSPEVDTVSSPVLAETQLQTKPTLNEQQSQKLGAPVQSEVSRLQPKDESINMMLSMKIFDDKTETIPMLPLKKNFSLKADEISAQSAMKKILENSKSLPANNSLAQFELSIDEKIETIPSLQLPRIVPIQAENNENMLQDEIRKKDKILESFSVFCDPIDDQKINKIPSIELPLDDKTEKIPLLNIAKEKSLLLPQNSMLEMSNRNQENVSPQNIGVPRDDKTETISNILDYFQIDNEPSNSSLKNVLKTEKNDFDNVDNTNSLINFSTNAEKSNSRATILPAELSNKATKNFDIYDIFIQSPVNTRLPKIDLKEPKLMDSSKNLKNENSFHASVLFNMKSEPSFHVPMDKEVSMHSFAATNSTSQSAFKGNSFHDSIAKNIKLEPGLIAPATNVGAVSRKTITRSSPRSETKRNKMHDLKADQQQKSEMPFNVFEEENINTENFASKFSDIRNSTLLRKELSFVEESEAKQPYGTEHDHSLSMTSFEIKKFCPGADNPMEPEPIEEIEIEQSIYRPHVSIPQIEEEEEEWDEISENFNLYAPDNTYHHTFVDMNATNQIIMENTSTDKINPFDKALCSALLDRIDFTNYLVEQNSCTLLNKITMLKPSQIIEACNEKFEVEKIIGRGTYGTIHMGKCLSTGKKYALKQERPSNLWELYICMELKVRLNNANMMPGFMDIEYSIIANNASIFISDLSPMGNIIDVCNKVKNVTDKKVDEYIGMILISQILSIIDHLHSCNIIHADVKPDNFLLMDKLKYGDPRPVIQLIDFGVSIDMKLFPPKTTFNTVVTTDGFTCTEMLENRPWTYQTDLFGVAGTAHVLLFGQYMQVENRTSGWHIRTSIPRYFNGFIWDTFFKTLLNIRDCYSMPNLQHLRSLLEEEIAVKEKYVKDKILEFNRVFA